MPRPSKGARLWLRPTRTTGDKRRPAVWLILDGQHQESTGCGAGDREKAERRLANYIAEKYAPDRVNSRSPSAIPIADVMTIYMQDIAHKHARPHETAQRCEALLHFFGERTLAEVSGATCRAYTAHRGSLSAARRELEDLRAAINHHRREGLCSEIVEVALPERSLPRERWLTRQEAARLLLSAWHRSPHIARFILVGIYTGTRAGAICGASLRHASGRGYVDLERGLFFRKAAGARETKKRQPTVTIAPRLLAHMRRWARLGLCRSAIVEWDGKPIKRVTKAFAKAAEAAGIEGVTPHTLRHTAATWLAENGCPTRDAARYLGMTEEMFLERYGHSGPQAHARAIEAIGARPKIGQRNK